MSGELACLAGALLVLPALLHVMRRPGEEAPRSSERNRRADADLAPRSTLSARPTPRGWTPHLRRRSARSRSIR